MGIGTILIGLALLIVVVTLIALPLLDQRRPAIEPPSPREALEAEREATVRAIRELDFDYRTHKLSDDDYKTLRATQVQRGAEILRELDALNAQALDGEPVSGAADGIDAEIEAQVAALRHGGVTCSSCGTVAKSGDRFCARCGTALPGTSADAFVDGVDATVTSDDTQRRNAS
jgi:hypothetical protein